MKKFQIKVFLKSLSKQTNINEILKGIIFNFLVASRVKVR